MPIKGTYRGYKIISAPPPSSGGMALVEILNILEGYNLAKQGADGSTEFTSPPRRTSEPSSIAPNSSAIPIRQDSRRATDRQALCQGLARDDTASQATPREDLAASVGLQSTRQLCQHASEPPYCRAGSHDALLGRRSRGQCRIGHDDAERRFWLARHSRRAWLSAKR